MSAPQRSQQHAPQRPTQRSSVPAELSVARPYRVAAAWSWRTLAILGVLAVLILLLAVSKVIWVPVMIALLLTVLLTPAVEFLQERLRFPRGLAVAAAVVGLLLLVGGLLTLAGKEVVDGFADLWEQAQGGLDELAVWLSEGPLGLDAVSIDSYLTQAREQVSANSGAIVSGALSATSTAVDVVVGAVVAIFCLIFFLKDGAYMWAWVLRLLPKPARMPMYEASRRGWLTLAAYTRTQILIAAVDAVGIGVGAAIIGIPLALPLGILVFLGSFIPLVGAIVTGSIAVLVALVDQGPGTALVMLLIVLAVQQIEGNVLEPLLMGHAVSLHPVAVLLVVTAGSLAAGIVGALLAVPIAATLNTLVLYLHGHDKFPKLGRNPQGLTRWLGELNDDDDGGDRVPVVLTDDEHADDGDAQDERDGGGRP